MKCVQVTQFGDSDVLKIKNDQVKPSPRGDEVLVQVKCVGVNPVDTYVRSGQFPLKPNLPYIPSSDISGEIVAIGKDVKREGFCVGQRVFGFIPCLTGGAAEYAAVPETSCGILPDHLTFEQGAAIGIPYLTAYDALFTIGKGKTGDKVLIHGGSGGVGLAAVELALSKGMDVYATASTQQGEEAIKKKGSVQVFNHRKPGYENEMMKATGSAGFDIILEMLANVNLGKDIHLLAKLGRVMVIGSHGVAEKVDALTMMLKCLSIHGVALLEVEAKGLKDMVLQLEVLMRDKKINPTVGKIYSLNEVGNLHDDLMSSVGKQGKLVLSLSS